jgi:hypothetical protein
MCKLGADPCCARAKSEFIILGFVHRETREKTLRGMHVVEVKEHEFVSGTWSTEVWEITAEEWRARRRNG